MRQNGSRSTESARENQSESASRFHFGNTDITRPVMALIAGVQAPSGRVMGHAGAFVGAGEKKAAGKLRALEDAGVVTTNHPSKFGDAMKRLLGNGADRAPSVSESRDLRLRHSKADCDSHHHHIIKPSSETCTLFEDLPYSLQEILLTSNDDTFTFQNLKAL